MNTAYLRRHVGLLGCNYVYAHDLHCKQASTVTCADVSPLNFTQRQDDGRQGLGPVSTIPCVPVAVGQSQVTDSYDVIMRNMESRDGCVQ